MDEMGGNILIKTSTYPGDWMVNIQISDTGPEISREHLPLIFQAGFSTKESGGGYGLWRARKLIEAVNGNITLRQSSHGKLTKTFVINVPDYYLGKLKARDISST
jgi:signal transduction histidine kinase